jgi:hypothetical protein
LANEAATHLAKTHPRVEPGTRRRLVDDIKRIPDVLRRRVELPQLQYPPPSTEPFPCLAPPSYDILKCRRCSFCVRQVQVMQRHCAKIHDWINPRGKGRPSTGYPPADPLPWTEGVACQRFFPSREGSKWFQVNIQANGRADKLKARPSPKKPQETHQALTPDASAHLQQVIDREA